MKTSLTALVLWCGFTLCVNAEPPDAKKVEFVDLSEMLYSTELLNSMYDEVQHPDKAKSEDDLETTRKRLERAKDSILKIRKLIKKGTSVFDYPGLLSLGKIKNYGIYSESKISAHYTYVLYIGAHFGTEEGVGDYDFNIVFNEKGIITAVESVDWKK